MRHFFKKLWHIITFPVRLIIWPFRRIKAFIDYEPEESSIPDAFAETIAHPIVLLDHLNALRTHLLRAVIAMVAGVMISFLFAHHVLDWLSSPIGGIENLQAIEVTESVAAYMRVALLSGLTLAFPCIVFEFFQFVNPGLRRSERIFILIAAPVSAILFSAGMAFAYYILLPTALPFLLDFMGITTVPRPANYVTFVTGLLFWIGIAFQFPLIIYVLASIGVVNAQILKSGWRFAIVGIAVAAAMITPTVDPVNMALVMAPMTILYFASILLAGIAQRKRNRRLDNE